MANYKSILCLLVHDRVHNLQRWLEAWKHCTHFETELYVIYTKFRNRTEAKIKNVINQYPGTPLITTDNSGMDIGAMRDVFADKFHPQIPNDWRYLTWCVDDAIPMKKTFLYTILVQIAMPSAGLCGIHFSDEYKPHIRTNMIAIKREVATKIKFPMEISYTRKLCYEFEHRGNDKILSLTEQVTALCYETKQITPQHDAIAWDIGHYGHLNHWEKFFTEFPSCRGFGATSR